MTSRTAMLAFVALLAACSSLRPAAALSYPVCDSYGAEWVTASPRLSGEFPFYQLLFFCKGNANVEGRAVDFCLDGGAACGQPAADAFCEYIGFDGAVQNQFDNVTALQPTRSLTGEWCAGGQYQDLGWLNRTQFEALAASHNATGGGPACSRLDSVTCYRTRSTLSAAYAKLQAPVAPAPIVARSIRDEVATAKPFKSTESLAAAGGRRRLRGWVVRQ